MKAVLPVSQTGKPNGDAFWPEILFFLSKVKEVQAGAGSTVVNLMLW